MREKQAEHQTQDVMEIGLFHGSLQHDIETKGGKRFI